jgi:hypothetical protein
VPPDEDLQLLPLKDGRNSLDFRIEDTIIASAGSRPRRPNSYEYLEQRAPTAVPAAALCKCDIACSGVGVGVERSSSSCTPCPDRSAARQGCSRGRTMTVSS